MPTATATILSEGTAMDASYQMLSIDICREVNRIPRAELRLIDGSAATQKFDISDTDFFAPGANIEIKLRYEGTPDTTVFKGVVVRHGIEAHSNGSVLVVGLRDATRKLTAARQSAVYQQQTDDAIVKKLITDAGLTAGTLTATKPEHPEMVQYYCTPWDFILSRADAQGLLVVVEDGTLSLMPMVVSGSPKYTFDYGISQLLNLELEADAGSQYEAVQSIAWDPKEQQATDPSKAKSVTLAPGNLDGEKLGQTLGNGTCTLSHPVPVAADELQAWADAHMARSRMALSRGRFAMPGVGDIKLLDVIQLSGVGKRFSGATVVTGLRQRVDTAGWQTDVQFGVPPEGFARSPDIVDAPAAGLLPGVSGLQIGVVVDAETDPDKELRVKVNLPGVDPKQGEVWARLASPEAGKGRGYYFRPEPQDEVVVGFFNGDPRHPVILGSLYGSKNTPADTMGTPDDKKYNKGIVTKKGTTIGFVDGDKVSVYIQTPKSNKLLLDDDGETVCLSDQHGNSITMSKDGIVLKSAKDLKIDTSGNVEIKGSKVDVK